MPVVEGESTLEKSGQGERPARDTSCRIGSGMKCREVILLAIRFDIAHQAVNFIASRQ